MSQWNPPHQLPEVPKGHARLFIVAVRREDGNVYRFPACWLNQMAMEHDDMDRPVESENKDSPFDFATGWHTEKEHDAFDSAYFPLDLNHGKDTLVGWQPLPLWTELHAEGTKP